MSSHNGIFRISKAELDRCADDKAGQLNCLTFGLSDGIAPSLECSGGFQPAAYHTEDGYLWFPTSKGLVGIAIQMACALIICYLRW